MTAIAMRHVVQTLGPHIQAPVVGANVVGSVLTRFWPTATRTAEIPSHRSPHVAELRIQIGEDVVKVVLELTEVRFERTEPAVDYF